MLLANLASAWRERAAQLMRYSEPASRAFSDAAAELEAAMQAAEHEIIDLNAAAEYSGYSSDHLRRLVAYKKLHAERRGRRLLFKRADLPLKPGRIDAPMVEGYDPAADARQMAALRANHGGGE